MEFYPKFVFLTFIFLHIYIFGLYTFLTNYEPNRCNMTYMYEYPQLVRISLPKNVTQTFKKYGLYAYGEGRYIQRVREMKFDGIPVLFIPGNRGSPKQVRSFASISLRKGLSWKTAFHFDYFAIDLNEDYSGLFGGFLKEQTRFVNICLQRIMHLYRNSHKPKSIVIIGHSMGGMIAKGLFVESDQRGAGLVKLIISLATPHRPALLTDPLIETYYREVNQRWDHHNTSNSDTSLISIGGGPRDLLVRSDLTITHHADLSVITPQIPAVWLSVDHLCVLWCKELILVLVRALFDAVDLRTHQITEDVQLRRNIFNYHLLNRSGGKSYHSMDTSHPQKSPLYFERRGGSDAEQWIQLDSPHMTWAPESLSKTVFFSVSLATPLDTLALQTVNHKTRDWIYACVLTTTTGGTKMCKLGENLSSKARISPSLDLKRKSAVINLSQLRMEGYTHVLIRTLPTKEFLQISFDLFKLRDRTVVGEPSHLGWGSPAISKTQNGSLFYSIELAGLSKVWQGYTVSIISDHQCSLSLLAEVAVRVPWSNEGSTNVLSGSKGEVVVSLLTPKPSTKDVQNVKVDMFLSPYCTYTVSVSWSYVRGLSSLVGRYGLALIPHITVCLLLTLAYQIKALGNPQTPECPFIHLAMPKAAKPYFLVQASAITGAIAHQVSSLVPGLPETDTQSQSGYMEVLVIPVFLHLTAFSLVYLVATLVLISVIIQGQAFYSILLGFVSKFSLGFSWLSEYMLTGASKVPVVVSAFMVTVCYSACGGLALFIGLGFYFYKLVSLYEDVWDEIVRWPLRVLRWLLTRRRAHGSAYLADMKEMPSLSLLSPLHEISFHLTLLLIWAISAIISAPSVLVWAKNYKYNTRLEPDPGFLNAVIMSLCAGLLWQAEVPKTKLVWSRAVGYTLVGASVLVIVYAQTSLYRLPYILSGVFLIVTGHQMVAPWFSTEEEDDDELSVREEGPVEGAITQETLEGDVEEPEGTTEEEGKEGDTEEELAAIRRDSNEDGDFENDSPAEEDDKKEEEGCGDVEGDGQGTPSSEASSSSFEHISERESLPQQ